MPCLRPIDVYNKKAGKSFLVPCGKCDECLNRRKMSFVFRVEQQMRSNEFKYCHYVTLTYSDKYLPHESFSRKVKGSPVDVISTGESLLCPYDLTQFFKRYRLFTGEPLKYFCAGEYGSEKNTKRPHYHIILFCNQNWKDCVHFSQLAWSYLVAETKEDRLLRYRKMRKRNITIKRDSQNMRNRELIGRVNVLSVVYRRICYVAKYCNKILYPNEVVPPFVRLSNGLGAGFLDSETCKLCKKQNRHHTYFENGLPVAIPRYYAHKMFTLEQMERFQLDLIMKSNPPDTCFQQVYEPMFDNDFFVLHEIPDHKKVVSWYKAYNFNQQVNVKRARLSRYGFISYG